jgi:hypothetical protein
MSKKEFELLQAQIESLAKQVAELTLELRMVRSRMEPNPYRPPVTTPATPLSPPWEWPPKVWCAVQ